MHGSLPLVAWIAAFALSTAAYLLVTTWTGPWVPRVLGLGAVLGTALVLLVVWAESSGHLVAGAAPALRFLTGLRSVGDVVPHCLTWGPGARWVLQIPLIVLVLGAAVANLVPAVAGVIGVPVGIVAVLAGGAYSAVKRDPEPVQFGLRVLSGALGCFVLAALVLRLLHAVYLAVFC